VHVDANERGAGGGCDAQCGAGVVTQTVDPDDQPGGLPHRAYNEGHGGHRFGRNGAAGEWRVAEVLHHSMGESGIGQRAGVGQGVLEERLTRCRDVTRTAR
jgi:hypothetical protein